MSKYFTGFYSFIFLVRFFLLPGLSTVSLKMAPFPKTNHKGIQLSIGVSRLAILYNVILMFLICAVGYMGITTAWTDIYGGEFSMYQILDFSQVTFCCLSAGIILCTYCRQSRKLAVILKRSYSLYQVLSEYNYEHHCYSMFKYVTVYFGLNFLIVVIFLVTGVLYFSKLVLFLTCFLPNTVVFWLVVQYAINVRVVLSMFRIANEAIRKTIDINYMNLRELNKKLVELHKIYSMVCRVSQDVSGFYGVPILCSVIYIFVCLVVYMYCLLNLVIDMYQPFVVAEYVHLAAWNVCFMLSIVILTKNVSSVMNEMQCTHNTVADLMIGVSGDLKSELKDFSWYFINKRIRFTASDFFSLDNTLVSSIINLMTTYLVILVQFQMQIVIRSPSNDSHKEISLNSA